MSNYKTFEKYFLNDFGYNEPIIVKEIAVEKNYDIQISTFQEYLSRLCDNKRIKKYENGILLI